jgi:hypothetical protein
LAYTLADLERAKSDLAAWQQRWDNYTGNNPDKYQADIRSARAEVQRIEQYLKLTGVIPLTEPEKLERELDAAFPNAKSREIVEYQGRKFQRRFFPLEKSRSRKTVTAWGRSWEELKEPNTEDATKGEG